MKKGIHPEYKPTTIVCSCGNTIETRSTQDKIHVEICAVCHPFYTGRQKLVDTAGRVERFNRKYGDVSSGAGEGEEEEESGGEEAGSAESEETLAEAVADEPTEEPPTLPAAVAAGPEDASEEEEEAGAETEEK